MNLSYRILFASVLRVAASVLSLLAPAGMYAQSAAPSSPVPEMRAASVFESVLPETNAKTLNISTDELKRALADGSTLLLDTRPYREFAISHIPGALNVAPKPGMSMAQYTSDVAEVERLVQGDKTRPLVLYCNGPFCGKSKRVAEDLLDAGFTNVRRYQLGAPVWRALGNAMVVELEGARHVFENDKTAYFIDARNPEQFRTGSIPGAKNIWAGQADAAKDDGRLPMEDHNTRIIVFGNDAAQARMVAEELAKKAAFHNVTYFEGTFEVLRAALR